MTATEHALTITRAAAEAAADKLGKDIVAYDVSEQLAITDVFLIVTATNERQVGAVVDGIEEALLKIGEKTTRREGDRENRWVLMDYLDLVVHVQHSEERNFYSLERLWRDCPRIELPDFDARRDATHETTLPERADDTTLPERADDTTLPERADETTLPERAEGESKGLQ